MKNNKINIILILTLILTLGTAGFLGYMFIKNNSKVEIPDFLGQDKQAVYDWCGKLDPKYSCEILYEENSSIEKDKVFYQSVNAGGELTDNITIKISNGIVQNIAVPSISPETIRSDIEKWASDNGVLSVTYVEEINETINQGNVIRIEPTDKISKDTPVTVYISSGPKKEEETTENKDNTSSSNIVVKASDYVGLSVADFESKVKALGLSPNHKTSKDANSSSVESGKIVWHGSGTYEKNETINYGVSLGSSGSSITIKSGSYVGKSENEYIEYAKGLGLSPNHKTEWDDYSDTVTKGNIVKHGSGEYEKGETTNYGLSLGKKDSSSSSSKEVYVSYGTYIGKTEDEFKKIATDLNLIPTHKSSKDDYSDTVAKGSIVWHGSGTYKTNDSTDPFNYGLSLGKKDSSSSKEIYVSYGTYIGKTEDEFKKIATDLNLIPTHKSSKDDYSDDVAKGSIIWHGSGTYKTNDSTDPFNYGLSLGKKESTPTPTPTPTPSTVDIASGAYVGKTESEFVNYVKGLGLNANHNTGWDSYSDSIPAGNIVKHGSGTYTVGETSNYGLSLGPQPVSEGTMLSFNDLASQILSTGDYNAAKSKMETYLNNQGFSNYSISGRTDRDNGAGVLLSISVDGNTHTSIKNYPTNSRIEVVICTGYEES